MSSSSRHQGSPAHATRGEGGLSCGFNLLSEAEITTKAGYLAPIWSLFASSSSSSVGEKPQTSEEEGAKQPRTSLARGIRSADSKHASFVKVKLDTLIPKLQSLTRGTSLLCVHVKHHQVKHHQAPLLIHHIDSQYRRAAMPT